MQNNSEFSDAGILQGMLEYAHPYLMEDALLDPLAFDLAVDQALAHPDVVPHDVVQPAFTAPAPIAQHIAQPARFKVLADSNFSKFTNLDFNKMADLCLAVSHLDELNRIACGQASPDALNLSRLLDSTHILAGAFANVAALLKVHANKANPLAHILHLPNEILLEIIIILAHTACPDVRRWDDKNLGWLSLYWSCMHLRMLMKGHAAFWALVCTQLPKAQEELCKLAGSSPLTFRVSSSSPSMPAGFGYGTSADKRRISLMLRATPANHFGSITSIDLRFCPSLILEWLAASSSSTPGLKRLTSLELEAPVTFDARFDKMSINRYIKRSFHNVPLRAPTLRYVKFRNLCYPFNSSQLRSFDLQFDGGEVPAPDCPRPTLSNIVTTVMRSAKVLRELHLREAINDEDEDQIASTIELKAMKNFTIAQNDSDLVQLCLSRLSVPSACNIRVEVQYNPSSSIISQMHALFTNLLRDMPNSYNRLLRVRFLGIQERIAKTEIAWTTDEEEVAFRISNWADHNRTIVLRTPAKVSWVTCLHTFAEALKVLRHFPVKTLILPTSQRAWEIKSSHEVDTEIAHALFAVGTVQYIWPPARVTWALGTNSALHIPAGHQTQAKVSFTEYVEEMRRVQAFNPARLQ